MKREVVEHDLGITAYSIMTECERHGIMNGCTTTCPVLINGDCELQDGENKHLWDELQ